MKKLLSIVLTLALIITLIPAYGSAPAAEAAGSFFLFPNEKDTKESARIVSDKYINLTGAINGVVGSSISYKIEQVTLQSDVPLNQTQDISTGIATTGDNTITVSNVELFPGLNKITFKGIAGTSTVSESIYIEFRNSPMLNDLKIIFENREHIVEESGPTMLYSTATRPSSTGVIVISGEAPNATKVTVEINGSSYDFNVSTSSSNYRFSTSQLSIRKGMNTIKFKVTNSGQVVETTRQVAFYNGEVTHYNQEITNAAATNPTKYSISSGSDYLFQSANGLHLTGTAIIPLPIYDLGNGATDPVDPPVIADLETALENSLKLTLSSNGGTPTEHNVGNITVTTTTITDTTKFITVNYDFVLPNLAFDTPYTFRIKAPNGDEYDTSSGTSFTLRDGSKAFIYDINYLSGFDSTMTTNDGTTGTVVANSVSQISSLQGTDIGASGVSVYSIPMGVELLIGNYPATNTDGFINSLINNITVTTNVGGSAVTLDEKIVVASGKPVTGFVTETVNGKTTTYLRVFLQFDSLPTSGSNTLTFGLNTALGNVTSATKSAIFKLLYGPYVKFDTIVDGMSIPFDSVEGSNLNLLNELGFLKGKLMNIANENEVLYEADGGKPQSVFLYVNNVEIPLVAQSTNAKTSFIPKNIDTSTAADGTSELISNVLNKAGSNTLKFVFRTPTNSYESIIKFNIVPSNLPEIPAKGTDGVYPYSANSQVPNPVDPRFTKSGSVYTTKEAQLNVYGTFDFIDLGSTRGQVTDKLDDIQKENYIVNIQNPDWTNSDGITWNLNNEFTMTENREPVSGIDPVINPNQRVSNVDANIDFFYDVEKESFYFIISGQQMPEDGSPLVYVITVYNAGVNGPRATYRLEINPSSIPYSIKSPVEERRVLNQNFVEVIISSPGADSIMIGKQVAEKVAYNDYVQDDGTFKTVEAFRAVVTDLKPNKEQDIDFTIIRGDTTLEESITVKYVPTNIPGAQYLDTMKANTKAFNNTLTLTFPKNTNLVRPSYNQSNDFATQVYNGNKILYAIANPNDGIVDRHLFEPQVPDYSADSQAEGNLHIGYRFQDLANRYIKASPLYWIDAGLADDPETGNFDAIPEGLDPFPYPNLANKFVESFADRWNQFDRELIPSQPGSLTLSFDPNIVQSAGTTIAVFRFDPYNSTWENIGGVVDSKKGTVTVPFTKFGYYVAVKLTRSYNDIIDHSYAREAMEAAYAKGIMNAKDPTGLFGGDTYVTRGEFTRMIVRALDLPLNYSGDMHFTYYPETITNANYATSIYDYRYIETAARAGIVNGTRPGFFDEDIELTRQDAAVMLARALELKLETDSKKAKTQLDKAFKDGGLFDFYAIPGVLAVQKKGFIVGRAIDSTDPKAGYVYDPKARMLRSDAAIIITRVMTDMKKLPKIYN